MDDLQDKVAVVTGAGSGIGRALASASPSRACASPLPTSKPTPSTRRWRCCSTPAQVLARPTDVTDAADVAELAADVYDRFGAAHVLCNNAGVFAGGLLWELDDATVDWVLDVNVRGILHGVRAFVPRMLAGGEPGHVVNTASSAGIFGSPYTGPYTVSKFAAVGMSEVLAWDLSISGAPIGVSVLCPGAVATRIGFSDRNRPAEDEAGKDVPADDADTEAGAGRECRRPRHRGAARHDRQGHRTGSGGGPCGRRHPHRPVPGLHRRRLRRGAAGPHRRPARRGAAAADRLHLSAPEG
ncbi:MAG: SDR family NAD(P)-dependent oxidoreductase [Acidimicrobiales bacterium]